MILLIKWYRIFDMFGPFLCAGKHTVYRMSAGTAEDKEEWMRCIK
jgi:hypothetical protein